MDKDIKRLSLILLMAPFALWILLLIVIPHIGIFFLSLREKITYKEFTYGLGNYIEFLNEPIYWNTLVRTGSMSLLVTILALLIGFPVAYYIAKVARKRSKGALFLLCLLPLWVSELIRTFGWILLLRETGVVSGFLQWSSASSTSRSSSSTTMSRSIMGLVYTVMLFMIVPLVSTLDGMDNAMIEAGYNLGGSGFTVLRRIIIPYAMPGIVAGCYRGLHA